MDDIRGKAQGTAPTPLSVLDLATVGAGQTSTDALHAAGRLARAADPRGVA
ncbi:alkanal monooxygenase, partial [Streptomyces sp. PGLac3x]